MPISIEGREKVRLERVCLNSEFFDEETLDSMKEKYFKLEIDYGNHMVIIEDSSEVGDDVYYKEDSLMNIPVEDVDAWVLLLKNRGIEVDLIHPDWEWAEVRPDGWKEYHNDWKKKQIKT